MDFKARVERIKRYKAGLQEAGQPRDGHDYVPIGSPVPPAGNRSFWFSMQVVVPLHDTFAFIVNNRLLRENMEHYVNQDAAQLEQDFNLPDDYFSLHNESAHPDECFGLRYDVLMAGADTFAQLINYIADKGYIAKSDRALFAYRFSAKQRPETVNPIEWHEPDNRPYELIYLVRALAERADYRKMRSFFTGPDWPARNTSSYAKGASFELKSFVSGLYPMLKSL